MPYTIDDFRKEVALEILHELSPEERMRGLTAEELLRGLSAEELLRGLSAEERLRGLSAAQIEAYLVQLRTGSKTSRRKKRNPKR